MSNQFFRSCSVLVVGQYVVTPAAWASANETNPWPEPDNVNEAFGMGLGVDYCPSRNGTRVVIYRPVGQLPDRPEVSQTLQNLTIKTQSKRLMGLCR